MIVYDLNSGHREYPGYDEIEDRRGGGRGRSRRSDGTYMEYGHGFLPPYDHYGMHEKMKEMEERENELEERERRLEERERRHEMEDREYRRMVTNPTRPITMETTDTTVTDLRCVEVADVAEVVLIEEQTQRIQLIRNM